MSKTYPFELMTLPYDYSKLELSISKTTVEFHHDKHHQTYVTNLNNALSESKDLKKKTLEEILKSLDTLPSDIATAVTNNAGGVFNHNFYFEALAAAGCTAPTKKFEDAIINAFGSFETFFFAGLEGFNTKVKKLFAHFLQIVKAGRRCKVVFFKNFGVVV